MPEMPEFFNPSVGIAVISLISSLIGAGIAVVGSVLHENMKQKNNRYDNACKLEIKCYEMMLDAIALIIKTKYDTSAIYKLMERDNINLSYSDPILLSKVSPLIENMSAAVNKAQTLAILYSQEDIREVFGKLCLDIGNKDSKYFNYFLAKKGLSATEFDTSEIEILIRKRILKLQKR